METIITNGVLVSDGRLITGKAIIIEGGYIRDIIDKNEVSSTIGTIDVQGAFIASGFIDLQVMGAEGAYFGSLPSGEALETMEQALLKQGTVGFLSTVSTNTEEVMWKVLDTAAIYRKRALGNFLGLHLEGPFLHPSNRGAHPEAYITKASLTRIREWMDRAGGEIRMITLAPELQDKAVLDYLATQSVVLSLGHSSAGYVEALHFFENGGKAVTHLFNGMPPMHHRAPGPIPAVFEAKPYTSIVADGIHVAYPMVKMAKAILGKRLFLISDAATPTTEGLYKHTCKGDRYVTVDGEGKEVLSGSALTMLQAIRNCVIHVGMPLAEAVNMATVYPAELIGVGDRMGRIQTGYEAHIVIFDSDYNISMVLYKGKRIV